MISINPYEIILQIVNFGILYVLLKHFLAKPLSQFLEKRAGSIQHNLEFAEVSKRKAEKMMAENKAMIKTAQLDAQAIRKKAEAASKKELQAILENGQKQAGLMIEQAKHDIQNQSKTAYIEITKNVSDLVVKVISKYMKANPSSVNQTETINDLVKQVSKT